MKRIKKIISLLVIGVILTSLNFSCLKDKSNYDYREINDVVIEGIENSYSAIMLDSLKITPVLTRTLEQREDDLEYYWILYNSIQTYYFADTLAKTRNLDILVNTVPGSYKITYRVKDKTTGVAYRKEFAITVTSELQRGYLVLSELEGKADVAFISEAGKVYESIYKNINEEDVGTHPVAIRYMYQAPLDYVAVLCDDARGGVFLSSLSFKKMFDYKEFFYNELQVIKPQAMEITETYGSVSDYQAFGSQMFILNDDKLHLRDINYTVNVDGVSTKVETKFYSAFPGDYDISPVTFKAQVFYDNKYKCFMYVANFATPSLSVTAATPDGVFDPANVGLELVWGKVTKSPRYNSYCNSIFKDDADNYYYLRFDIYKKNAIVPIKKVPIPSDFKIKDATAFTGNTIEDYIYFALGSKIYIYDCILNQEREVYDFGTGKTVDNIRWHEAVIKSRVMHVCVRDNSATGRNGSVYEMNVANDGTLSVKASYLNICGKVVSTHWKN
jgi:uncharacterized membrane protein